MNAISRAVARAKDTSGQSIYQTMLIISCVALAVAIFFPVYEFVQLYGGPEFPEYRPSPVTTTTAAPAEEKAAVEAPAPVEEEGKAPQPAEKPPAEEATPAPPAEGK